MDPKVLFHPLDPRTLAVIEGRRLSILQLDSWVTHRQIMPLNISPASSWSSYGDSLLYSSDSGLRIVAFSDLASSASAALVQAVQQLTG